MNNSFKTRIGDKLTTFTHLGTNVMPTFDNVTAVMGIPFTKDGQLVAVNLKERGYDLPGGHVEPYEKTPTETLRRELMEEAFITLSEPLLIDVVKTDYFDNRATYMLFYTAFVDEFLEFQPNNESSERLVISISDFMEHYQAGNDKRIIEKSLRNAWAALKKH